MVHLHTFSIHLIQVAVLVMHCHTTVGEGSLLQTVIVEAVLLLTRMRGGSTIAFTHI